LNDIGLVRNPNWIKSDLWTS